MEPTPDQITKLTIVKPQSGKEQVLLDAMRKYAKTVETEDPNTLSWHIIDIKEPGDDGGKEFAVLERYTNEAAEQAHFNTPSFGELKATMASLRAPISSRRTNAMGGFMMRK